MPGVSSFFAPFLLGATTLAPSTEVSLLFAGDAMQHSAQIEAAKEGNRYNYAPCFEWISDEIASADYAVVNLEAPIGGRPHTGYPCFSAPDEYAIALQQAGFDLFLTANNHSLDRYSRGAIRTLHLLDSIGVDHIGSYRSPEELRLYHPFMKTIKGIRIAFLNYTYGTNGFTPSPPLVINYIDPEQIKQDIRTARALDAELIVACVHWGDEYQLLPNKSQQELADLLVDEGVQLVIGAHPHVIQPMEIRYDTAGKARALVVYSLGNFISNMKTCDTVGGAIVKVSIARDEWFHITLKSAQYALVYTCRPSQKGENFVVVPAMQEAKYNPQRPYLNEFMKRARNIFDKYNQGVEEYTPKYSKPSLLYIE